MQPSAGIMALIALGGYPLFIVALFLLYRPPVAVTLSLLIGEMVLPSVVNLPLHPNWLGKSAIPPLVTFLCAMIFARPYLRKTRPFRGIEGLFLIWLAGCFFTWLTNRDPVQYGNVTLPPQVFSDFVSDALRVLCDPWVCFFLGRAMYRTSRDLMSLHRMAAVSVAIFTLPVLYEIRMSPQISNIIYGFLPSMWGMVYRWGGYRPLVTFPTGIHLASFMLVLTVMAVAMARAKGRIAWVPMRALCVYLVIVLILCKSTGAIVYAAVLVPVVVFASPRRMLQLATALTAVFLLYPALRSLDLIPTTSIAKLFANISADRADSLQYRFDMEQGMLDLASKRPWWGWGGYSRGFVHDPRTGATLSIPDGAVVINLSLHGWAGFLGYFFPYAYTILRAPKLIRRIRSRSDRILLSALCLNSAVVLLDLIFNTSFFPIYMLFIGAIYGLCTGIPEEEANATLAEAQALEYEPRYQPAGDYALPR
jgi:hypothetical protein